MSLRSLLSQLIWLCVVPLVLLAAYLATSSVMTTQAERDLEASNLAESFTTVIDQHLHARISALHILAESSLVDDAARWKDLYREAQGYHRGFGSHVIFADMEMRMLFNTRVPFGVKLPMLPRPKGHAAAPAAAETGKPAIGDVFPGPIAKEPLVAIAVPVQREGKTTFLLLTIFETRQFQNHLAQVALPPGWSLTLFDGKQEVIARRAPPDLNYEANDKNARRFVVKSTVSPWSVVLDIPSRVYFGPLIRAAIALAIAILGITLISLIGGRLTSRFLARSVASLAETPAPGTPPPKITEIAVVRRLLDESAQKREAAETALRESEQHLRATFDHAAMGIALIALNGCFLRANRKLCDIVGYSQDKLLTRTFRDITHPDDLAANADFGNRMLTGEIETYLVETRYIHMDGRTVWINLSVALTWKPDGMADYFIFTFEDITERKRIEAALRESERRYRLIAENTSDVIWLLDLTLDRFTYVSPSVERLFGLTSEVVMGLKMHQVLLPETYRTVSENLRTRVAHFEAGAESLRISTGNLDQLRKDGSFVSTEVVTTLITDESGRVNMIMGISRDISERKRAEASLKKSEERYRLIAENTSDVIWLVDIPSGRFTYVSPSVERLRGYTSEEVMGQTMEQVLPPEAYRLISKTLPGRIARFQAGDETQRTTTRNVDQLHKNGSTVSTEVATTLIMNENGRVAMILGVSRDITERRHAEEEKEKLQDQLLQAQKMESVGRLAGGVAHDFNNMLGVILGHVELAMDHVSPGHPLHADLQGIMKAAEHSADLTHQLLAFARKQVISPKVINLNKTVEGMLKMMRRLIGEDIQLDWQPEANLWSVKMDPSQIDQILANLCVNARDAITGVGKITAETGNITFDESYCADHAGFLPGDFVLLAMSDDGCGMDKEVIDKLFEPFFTTKEMGKGTGLGLATVYGIVRQNDGFINVYSEPGQGTTFRIYLPRFAGINEHARIAESQAVAVRGHETILVVEDELEILNLARYMLERQGYQVLTAGRPGAAIRLAGNYAGEIHLLLTDVVMPEMNGRELANKMLSLYPNLKCLFMSGYTANIIALQGILDEGMHFIQKPFSKNDLATKVRETLDQKSSIEDGSI